MKTITARAALLVATMAAFAAPGAAFGAEPEFGTFASAPLSRGALAVYGSVGYPRLETGFRQGFPSYEVGAEAGYDYLRTQAFGAGTLRLPMAPWDRFAVASEFKLGLFGNDGGRYHDLGNQRSLGLGAEAGLRAVLHTDWPVSFNFFGRMPFELPVTDSGNARLAALVGGGAEIAVAPDQFVVFSGGFGPDVRWRTGYSDVSLAVELMVGFGYRLF